MKQNTPTKEDLIKTYDEEAQKILIKMYQIVAKANRKVEDSKYRDILAQIEKE